MEYSPKLSEHEHIESNYRLYSAHTRPSRFVSPADRLPEELLVSIIKILIEPRPSSIGPLLFISRYWHHVAVTTPSLWSKIHSGPRSLEGVRKDTKYVQTAVKNSASLPLDIAIDLQNLDCWSENDINTTVSHKDREHDREILLYGLIKAFVGDNRINAARLRSISLNNMYQKGFSFISGEYATSKLLKELDCPTPLLESLSLRLTSVDPYFKSIASLQDLRALKHLIVDAGGRLGYIKFIPKMIQTLFFRLWGTTKVLSQFTGLRNLSIANWANAGLSYDADPELTFPLLECLTWRLWHPSGMKPSAALLPHKIKAPSLTTLRLLDADAIVVVGDADTYHHVHTLDLLSSAPEEIIGFVKQNLYKYTALVNLTVFPRDLDVVRDEIRALQDQAPTGLNSLYTILSDKEGTVVDASIKLPSWRPAKDYIYRKDDTFTGR